MCMYSVAYTCTYPVLEMVFESVQHKYLHGQTIIDWPTSYRFCPEKKIVSLSTRTVSIYDL